MEQNWSLQEAIEYYRSQDLNQNQHALVELLREVQQESGGYIPKSLLTEISAVLKIKESFLEAIIKRYPSLRTEEAPHRLELCGGERCAMRGCRELCRFVEEYYQVKNGGVSKKGRFVLHITGCMKNCPHGPSIKWDGKLYSGADRILIQKVVRAADN